MVCEAEVRQVQEYYQERERIATEHINLKTQIEELKLSLELAQLQRKRKIEYDAVAEKINSLPSRDELAQSISSLENDMAAIQSEHENQNRVIQAQKVALDGIINDLTSLRLMGKHDATEVSRGVTPAPDAHASESEDIEMGGSTGTRTREESGELKEERDGGEDDKESDDDIPLAKALLNPVARPFVPQQSRTSTPIMHSATTRSTPAQALAATVMDEDDIEMGELAEEPKDSKVKKKAREEELEEGEASDSSSELSEPPDD
ncbi:hypothetical protein AcW1_004731 [Taiwanofungus camphoratus]|nr:hypothetical protein AcW2_006266 [Antrodia cinnamomea]KAI0938227.1 hypothetical protein AcV7_003471 [Antrodia cinnamomea]KAI0939835.1 hypothetical protein AcV5_001113 [Antrodia cinnamomea]KAI0960123.1 hypothetical protein AcW1_004731 [Antrodia cinnamomea]